MVRSLDLPTHAELLPGLESHALLDAAARGADHLARVALDVAQLDLHRQDEDVSEDVDGVLQRLHGAAEATRLPRDADLGLLVAEEDVFVEGRVERRICRHVVDLN